MRRSFPLVANPPPGTMLMRATNEDFSVFGEEVHDGSLQTMVYRSIELYSHHATLRRMVGSERRQTVATLVELARSKGVSSRPDALLDALEKGTATATPEGARDGRRARRLETQRVNASCGVVATSQLQSSMRLRGEQARRWWRSRCASSTDQVGTRGEYCTRFTVRHPCEPDLSLHRSCSWSPEAHRRPSATRMR